MELKKKPDDGLDDLYIKGDGVLEEPQRKDPIRKKYSDDYSRTGTNTGYADNVIEEWDESIERNSFQISAKEAEAALAKTTQEKKKDTARFLRVSEIIMYLAFAFVIVMIILLVSGNKLDILFNLNGLKISLIVLYAYLIVDSILVYNNIVDKQSTIFVVAILFPVIYPPYRNRLANDTAGFGILCSILYVISFLIAFVTFGQTYNRYGKLLMIEDENIRHSAVDVLEQKNDKGKAYINLLQKWIEIEDVSVGEKKNNDLVTFTGTGKIDYDNGLVPITDSRVPTTLVFEKPKNGTDYTISTVTIKDKKLIKSEMEQYWTYIEGK